MTSTLNPFSQVHVLNLRLEQLPLSLCSFLIPFYVVNRSSPLPSSSTNLSLYDKHRDEREILKSLFARSLNCSNGTPARFSLPLPAILRVSSLKLN